MIGLNINRPIADPAHFGQSRRLARLSGEAQERLDAWQSTRAGPDARIFAHFPPLDIYRNFTLARAANGSSLGPQNGVDPGRQFRFIIQDQSAHVVYFLQRREGSDSGDLEIRHVTLNGRQAPRSSGGSFSTRHYDVLERLIMQYVPAAPK